MVKLQIYTKKQYIIKYFFNGIDVNISQCGIINALGHISPINKLYAPSGLSCRVGYQINQLILNISCFINDFQF